MKFDVHTKALDEKVDMLDEKFSTRLDGLEAQGKTLNAYVKAIMKHLMNDHYDPDNFEDEDED